MSFTSQNTKASTHNDKPFRAEILSRDQLAQEALELAEFYSQVKVRGRAVKLQQRFKENCRILSNAYFAFSLAARNKEVLTAGAEWILDNYHVIDAQVREIRRDLPTGYYKALPKLIDPEWRGYPRVYRLVCDYLSHTDSVVDTESLTTFIDAYQQKNELLIGELWAVPIMLRLALVENLRRLAQNSLEVAEQRRIAEKICQETIDLAKDSGTDLLLSFVAKIKQNPQILDVSSAHIMRRLRAAGGQASLVLQWVDQQLRERGVDPAETVRAEQQSQAQDQISVGNCITALRAIGSLNWRDWIESVSHIDAVLRNDPSGIYSASDFTTRDLFRHSVEVLARKTNFSEVDVARQALEIAVEKSKNENSSNYDIRYKHVGYYLIDDGLEELEEKLGVQPSVISCTKRFCKNRVFTLYLGSILAITGILLAAALIYSANNNAPTIWLALAAILLPIPLSEFAITLTQWVVTKCTKALPLPKMEFDNGIPNEARTLVTIQTIFSHTDQIDHTLELLEVRAIANQDDNIGFGVLADLCDSPSEVLSGDMGVIKHAEAMINDLNRRYCHNKTPRFFIMFRKRLFNEKEGNYMAWERKRGKIMEFNRWLRGDVNTTFNVIIGDEGFMKSAKYILTLDNDSQLPVGAAKKMIGAIAHPLNHPIFDEKTNVVVKGYSLLQPRVGITLGSGNATLFSSVFSGHSGLDPYTRTICDVYQDLFKEGSYIGKGVYDIDAFERALDGRFGENTLLSHDLIEGVFVRCGLLSDVEVYDDFPLRYHAQAKRQHRWMRGDWQILPWIFPYIPNDKGEKYPNPLSPLSRWKICDNLRRSLYAPSLFLALLSLWAFAPGDPLIWFAGLLLITSFSVYSQAWRLFFDLPIGYSFGTWALSLLNDVRKNILLVFFTLALIPHQAYMSTTAIVVTLYRLYFSKKRLLEWETAYATERRLGAKLMDFVKHMFVAELVLLVALVFSVYFYQKTFQNFTLCFYLTWLLSPVIAWAISLPVRRKVRAITDGEQSYLKLVAYETWRYFDTFLCPEYNYLIPDNLQIVPSRVIAERTSPTNISLSLLSVISAYDLGFTPLPAAINRLANTFATLKKLERYKGHFLNWYAIRDLRPLFPRYVSSVDSGNLVGHFVAIREMLLTAPFSPIISAKHIQHLFKVLRNYQGLSAVSTHARQEKLGSINKIADYLNLFDSLRQIKMELAGSAISPQFERTLNELLKLEPLFSWARHLPLLKTLSEKKLAPSKLKSVDRILKGRAPTFSLLFKLTNRLLKLDKAVDRAQLSQHELGEFNDLIEKLDLARSHIMTIQTLNDSICEQIVCYVREADFKFLSDPQRKLLTIGFNVDTAQKDNSYYDLLASEARLASLIAVAKGDLPQAHWFKLNRALTETAGGKALLSWTGTMFEYLMPLLVMKDYSTTLLSETYHTVVKAQRTYCKLRRVPWGISESAFSGVDFEKTYQYRAFGIPGLGLKRGLAEDLVVSPYSTMLALMIDAPESIKNLKALEIDGLRGEFGFYEAVDYTPERLSKDEKCHVVKNFLAHHQGMSLIAINNLLNKGIFQERFHTNLSVKACELLLQEKFPTRIPILYPHKAEIQALGMGEAETKAEPSQTFKTPHTLIPRTRILANRRYSLIIDNAGSGYSSIDTDLTLTRFNEDALTNDFGSYVYIRDLDANTLWSTTYQPTCVEPEYYEATFSPDKVEFRRKDYNITARSEITVSPEDNVEVRRVTLVNTSPRLRNLEVTSFGEVCLTHHKGDLAHPAFAKMFIESEYLEDYDALIFHRRPRSDDDRKLYMMHLINMSVVWAPTQYETGRQRFIGRGCSPRLPVVMQNNRPLSRTVGNVLDPIFSLRSKVEVKSGESQQISFVTGFAESYDEIVQLVKKYREGHYINRAFEMAWSHSDIELRHQQFSIGRVRDFQKLANVILFNITKLRGAPDSLKKNRLSQTALWRFGISGDEPIVLVVLNDPEQLKFAEELIFAHEYLRLRGFRFDLLLLNEYPGGYMQDFQQELDLLIRTGVSRDNTEKRGGVFLRSVTQLSEEEIILLHSTARVVLHGNRGTLRHQLAFDLDLPVLKQKRRSTLEREESTYRPPVGDLEFFNEHGGFTNNGKSYSMIVTAEKLPPKPWINVIANKNFGFTVSETGGGYTWADNSRENRITPWANDPTRDTSGEVIYIRDQETGTYWTPTLAPVAAGAAVRVQHNFGYSDFLTRNSGITSNLTISGAVDEPVKWWHLELTNDTNQERKLELFLYLEWVLGVVREESYRHIISGFENEHQMLYAQNPFSLDFSQQVVFLGSNLTVNSYTSNRFEFIGRHRSTATPLCLDPTLSGGALGGLVSGGRVLPVVLSGTIGGGLDSCGAIKVQVDILPGAKQTVLFYLGKAQSLDEAKRLAPKYRSIRTWGSEFEAVKSKWSKLTSTIEVKTPERSFDILTNGWLLYQTLGCRLYARTGLYQCSGAMGFRDQLQDSMAMLYVDPAITRNQILVNASRQFIEGDVQHWWHPPFGRGIRTRVSDNYLWLPFAVDEYLRITGDTSILEEQVGFIESQLLEPDQHEIYNTPNVSSKKASIYEHCLLALNRAMEVGAHGLPLIGSGDWNDGLNCVGVKGQGESVWLAWFIAGILDRFALIVSSRGDEARAAQYQDKARSLVNAVETTSWDGEWYRRAYFDDGTPLGSKDNSECRIDSLTQSWSVITGLASPERQEQALQSVFDHLVNAKHRMIHLLWPPFDKTTPNPGYIQGYPKGLRENGGQYTHAAAWVVLASALQGKGNKAFELFQMINPITHTSDIEGVTLYRTEPYVLCGDVYGANPHVGRGGWSWYTGSSGWLYRTAIEHIIGLKVRGDAFTVEPCIPSNWDKFSVTYRHNGKTFQIEVFNPSGVESGVKSITVDGQNLPSGWISLNTDKDETRIVVTMV